MKDRVLYIRNLIFGAEDSLVSTVGLLSGIAAGGVPKDTIILTGIVLVAVEAFSMGVGSYLTEYSLNESINDKNMVMTGVRGGASIMFISYVVSGLVPLWPYIFFENPSAFYLSVFSSLAGLFVLGYLSASILHIRVFRSAVRMLFLGGFAILIGIVVGKILS